MSSPWIALLAGAVAVLLAAEWVRVNALLGGDARRARSRTRRKANLTLLRTELPPDSDDFAASVQRDLSQLPTTEERDRRKR